MPDLRLFIAAEVPPEIRGKAAAVARRARSHLELPGTRISWVRENNLHFTLKFLGDTAADTVDIISRSLDAACARHRPFSIKVRGTGCFPSAGRPRVVWMGLSEGAERLSALAADIEREMTDLGFPPEARMFSPHLTLGRIKAAGHADFAAALKSTAGAEAGTCTIGHVTLFRSVLDPSGAIYTPLNRSGLGCTPGA
jgi:2'-5' RNA ligase